MDNQTKNTYRRGRWAAWAVAVLATANVVLCFVKPEWMVGISAMVPRQSAALGILLFKMSDAPIAYLAFFALAAGSLALYWLCAALNGRGRWGWMLVAAIAMAVDTAVLLVFWVTDGFFYSKDLIPFLINTLLNAVAVYLLFKAVNAGKTLATAAQ